MRELRVGDRVITRVGAKSVSGYELGGLTAVVRSRDSYFETADTTIYLEDHKNDGYFNVLSDDLTRIPKHRAEGEAN